MTAAAALAATSLAPVASACRLFSAAAPDHYVAWQGERAIGHQDFSYTREPGRFVVDVELGMRFVSPGLGPIDYSHESHEIWQAGWLHALHSRTYIGAREQVVQAERQGGALMVEGSDVRAYRLGTYIVPSNLWHRDSRLVDAFIDVENGAVRRVQPRFLGKESLRQGGALVVADHYTIRGQLAREAWYDADCALVRWDLPLTGGSWIIFRRELS